MRVWVLAGLALLLLLATLLCLAAGRVETPLPPVPAPTGRTTVPAPRVPIPAPAAHETQAPQELAAAGTEAAPPGVPAARPVTILVLDEATRAPRPDAIAWIVPSSETEFVEGHGQPGTATVAGDRHPAGEGGRIRLMSGNGFFRIAVKAPATAWTLQDIPYDRDEVEILLVSGGTVKLVVENWRELEEVRLYSGPGLRGAATVAGGEAPAASKEGESVVLEDSWRRLCEPVPAPDAAGVILLEGVPCGPRTWEARRGNCWSEGDVYGTACGVVRAGETLELTMTTIPTKAGPRAPITATLAIAPEWGPLPGKEAAEIRLLGRQPTNATVDGRLAPAVPPEGRTLSYRSEPVPPGRYTAESETFGWRTEFEVPEGGGRFAWTVPAPATLRIRLVDAISGKGIPGAQVTAHISAESAIMGPPPAAGGEEGEYVLRVVPARWEVEFTCTGYAETTVVMEATGPSDFRRTVAMKPAGKITVHLRLDGKPYTGDAEANVERAFEGGEMDREFEDVEAGGIVTGFGTTMDEGTCEFGEMGAGKWTVTVKEIPGFEPLPGKSIDVVQGGEYEVSFDLVRAK